METRALNKLKMEAESSRFDAKMNGENYSLRILYGFSEFDALFGSTEFFWDLWIKFPFRIKKDERVERFKEGVQTLFKDLFLS